MKKWNWMLLPMILILSAGGAAAEPTVEDVRASGALRCSGPILRLESERPTGMRVEIYVGFDPKTASRRSTSIVGREMVEYPATVIERLFHGGSTEPSSVNIHFEALINIKDKKALTPISVSGFNPGLGAEPNPSYVGRMTALRLSGGTLRWSVMNSMALVGQEQYRFAKLECDSVNPNHDLAAGAAGFAPLMGRADVGQ